jgi:hypothetical protein
MNQSWRGVAVVAFVWAIALAPRMATANVVDEWNVIAQEAIVVNAARAGAHANVDYAYVHIAIYDAISAIDGRYEPFAVRLRSSARGGSPEAAAATAAYVVLKWLFPTQQAFLDGAYASYMAGIPAGSAKTIGTQVGTEVGNRLAALRTDDGRNANVPYVFASRLGSYQLTPGCAAVVTPWLGQMKTFAVESASQFRVAGPRNLTSAEWAVELEETRLYGSLTGSLRSSAETRIGQFYLEAPGTWFARNIRAIATANRLSVSDSARYFAQMFVTVADSLITTWNSKYHFNLWRPTTAIQGADTDNNPMTRAEPTWAPLASTPCHPEYPSGHGGGTGGLAYALERFFSTGNLDVTLTSTSVPGELPFASQRFTSTRDMVDNVIAGRIYGGMHYRTSNVDGAVIGHRVAQYVADRYFRRTE